MMIHRPAPRKKRKEWGTRQSMSVMAILRQLGSQFALRPLGARYLKPEQPER
jgi:hypothetical protein